MVKSKPLQSSVKKLEKHKARQPAPTTADEYLAEGVKNEEAGEKWRAGDAAKSTRFFVRALEDYQAGLHKFPKAFDLAYNKARLQYDLAQQPRLLDHLPHSLMELLNVALESHRYALGVNQDNADLLFNTAQVLTSIAETSIEKKFADITSDDTLRLLQEALELFQRCYSFQEFQLTQIEDLGTPVTPSPAQGPDSTSDVKPQTPPNTVEEEVWALIEDPITKDSLADTLMAQLMTLTTTCHVSSACSSSNLGWIEEYYRENLQRRIEMISVGSESIPEINLTKAKFLVSFADASFHGGAIDILTYEREINDAFCTNLELHGNEQGLYSRAEVELTFVTSVLASIQGNINISGTDFSHLNSILWRHITKALDDLTTATKLPQPENVARSHLRRGDCELMRYGLGKGAVPYELAAKSAPTLIKNAEVFYRGAAKVAHGLGAAEEEREALVKEAVAAKLSGSSDRFNSLLGKDKESTLELVVDMQEEYLLSSDAIEHLKN